MKDSVELCQRSGRARQQDSSIVILDERPDRPLTALETARDLQDQVIATYDPATAPPANDRVERNKQQSREQSAYRSVFADPNHQSKLNARPLHWLHLYTKKTKASLSEEPTAKHHNTKFVCTLTYRSVLRTIKVDDQDTNEKTAKNKAAITMLAALKKATAPKTATAP